MRRGALIGAAHSVSAVILFGVALFTSFWWFVIPALLYVVAATASFSGASYD